MPDLKRFFLRGARLKRAEEYSFVFDEPPIRASNSAFILLAKPNQPASTRLGLAVSKKNIRKAHQRNTVKRLLRESFRQRQHELAGLDIVAIAKRGASDLDKPQLWQQLEPLWAKLITRYKSYS
ncbi:MAG: ribonuclease P protein component [Legionellales bacterium]|nr:ribonuclease P protein component [Legionellales bacterium]